MATAELLRLDETRLNNAPWKKRGPYLSERQWGTVREDYSDNGAGLGASHQTGWTGVVARMIQWLGHMTADATLEGSARPGIAVYREE